jgi:hypothetical protein
MPLVGLESDSASADCKTKLRQPASFSGAAEGAFDGKTADFDPDLARVVNAWPSLPEHVRAAILALVREEVG